MAKFIKPSSKPAAKPASAVQARTEVRNSPIPKSAAPAKAAPAKKEITTEAIALHAYYISQSGTGGSDFENWIRAERELRGS